MTDTARRQQKTERQDRLAEALRANLRRRKAQQKEWRNEDGPTGNAAAGELSRSGEDADGASEQEPG